MYPVDRNMSVFSKVEAFKESRLPSLYSDFSHLKEFNPEGYNANIEAWKQVLRETLRQHTFKSSITLPSNQLAAELLNPKFGAPQAIPEILDHLVRSGHLIPWSVYLKSLLQYKWRDLLSPSAMTSKALSRFSIGRFSLKARDGTLRPEVYVEADFLGRLSKQVKDKLQEISGKYSDILFDNAMITEALLKSFTVSAEDVDVLLTFLLRESSTVLIRQLGSETFIKVGADFTDDDVGIIKIKQSLRRLADQLASLVNTLETEIQDRISKLAKQKNADALRSALVRRNSLRKSLKNVQDTEASLLTVLDKINEAHGNISVAETMAIANATLRLLNSKISISDLDDLQVELEQEMEKTTEITDALGMSNGEENEEIENELRQLELEAKEGAKEEESEEKQELLKRLPSLDEDLTLKVKNLSIEDGGERSGEVKEKKVQNTSEALVA